MLSDEYPFARVSVIFMVFSSSFIGKIITSSVRVKTTVGRFEFAHVNFPVLPFVYILNKLISWVFFPSEDYQLSML